MADCTDQQRLEVSSRARLRAAAIRGYPSSDPMMEAAWGGQALGGNGEPDAAFFRVR